MGRELTVPLVAQSVVLTRAQARSTAMPETESLARFAATRATLALHLAITRTREVMATLEPEHGADCPVVVVYRERRGLGLIAMRDEARTDAIDAIRQLKALGVGAVMLTGDNPRTAAAIAGAAVDLGRRLQRA